MTEVLVFWLLVAGLGVAALPFAELLFGRLPSRGLVFARPLGILLVALPVWLLPTLHLVPYRRSGALLSVAALAAAGILLRRRGLGQLGTRATGRSMWLAGAPVFTVAFSGWALLRSFSPDVTGSRRTTRGRPGST